jgi:hypothetical protein
MSKKPKSKQAINFPVVLYTYDLEVRDESLHLGNLGVCVCVCVCVPVGLHVYLCE